MFFFCWFTAFKSDDESHITDVNEKIMKKGRKFFLWRNMFLRGKFIGCLVMLYKWGILGKHIEITFNT